MILQSWFFGFREKFRYFQKKWGRKLVETKVIFLWETSLETDELCEWRNKISGKERGWFCEEVSLTNREERREKEENVLEEERKRKMRGRIRWERERWERKKERERERERVRERGVYLKMMMRTSLGWKEDAKKQKIDGREKMTSVQGCEGTERKSDFEWMNEW